MSTRLLIMTAVPKEAQAIGTIRGANIMTSGVGRTNAAAATTEALVLARHEDRPITAVISAGVAGALPDPGSNVTAAAIGDAVVASACVYAEEGILTPDGLEDMNGLGFPLGDWSGNAVPVDPDLLAILAPDFATAPIATVATCSGTDAAASDVARRTGAIAEAMEGAAVVHAARRLGVPAIEVRVISNTTGNRATQIWDLPQALAELGRAIERVVGVLR